MLKDNIDENEWKGLGACYISHSTFNVMFHDLITWLSHYLINLELLSILQHLVTLFLVSSWHMLNTVVPAVMWRVTFGFDNRQGQPLRSIEEAFSFYMERPRVERFGWFGFRIFKHRFPAKWPFGTILHHKYSSKGKGQRFSALKINWNGITAHKVANRSTPHFWQTLLRSIINYRKNPRTQYVFGVHFLALFW